MSSAFSAGDAEIPHARSAYDPIANQIEFGVLQDNELLPSVIWHITDRCPLSCPYCFATKTQREMSSIDAEKVADALSALATQKVDLAGGEPLTCRSLPRIVASLINRKIHVTITTSGAGSARMRAWVVQNAKIFARVIISLDGGARLHDELRGRINTYNTAVTLGRAAVAAGGLLRVNSVATTKLVQDVESLSELAQTIVSINAHEWMLIQPHPANEKPNFAEYRTESASFQHFTHIARRLVRDAAPNLKILVRNVERYAQYWVIYPDGMLRRHTSGPVDTAGTPLSLDNLDAIKRSILTYGRPNFDDESEAFTRGRS